jgi:FG-GAP-like repeat/Bacterial pre-peptidase C-terminal domain
MPDNPINPSTSFANATQITLQTAIQPYKYALTSADPIDVYKFTLNSSNTLSFSLTELSSNARLRLFSETAGTSGATRTEITGLSNNPAKLSDYISREFAAGTYYVQVESDPNPPGNTTLVNYTLGVKSLTTAASPVKPFIDWRQQRNNISLRRQTDGSVGFWSMNGTTFLGAASSIIGQEWQQIGAGDTNADNKTDIVWLNTTTNDLAIWLVDGTRVTSAAVVGRLPQGYQVAGLDDFNGDGKTDLLLRNETSGDIAAWLLNGTAFLGAGLVASLPKEWTVYGTADVSGDGKADIVLFNQTTRQAAVWLLNGTQLVDAGAFQLPEGWNIQGLGDVNNDRRADLLLRNDTTGDAATWLLNGKNFLAAAVYGNIPTEWKIQRFGDSNSSNSLGDFNGDGNADILWRNTLTGAAAIWLTNGINIINAGVLPISANWKIEGAADYNRDGKTDLLWREETTGQIVQWLMNGVGKLSEGSISGVPLDWQLAGGTPITVTTQPLSISGDAFATAFNVGTLDATGTYSDLVSPTVSDYFKFNLANTSFFEMTLTPSVLIPAVGSPRKNPTLSKQVVNPTTGVITYQDITYTGRNKLDPGTYYVKVANFGVSDQTYALTLKGEPLIVNLVETAEALNPTAVVLNQRSRCPQRSRMRVTKQSGPLTWLTICRGIMSWIKMM